MTIVKLQDGNIPELGKEQIVRLKNLNFFKRG